MNWDFVISVTVWTVAIGWILLMLNNMRKVIKKNKHRKDEQQ